MISLTFWSPDAVVSVMSTEERLESFYVEKSILQYKAKTYIS